MVRAEDVCGYFGLFSEDTVLFGDCLSLLCCSVDMRIPLHQIDTQLASSISALLFCSFFGGVFVYIG